MNTAATAESHMRRLMTFVLLGPFLVWLTLLATMVPHLIQVPSTDPLPMFAIALPIAVIVCFVPALVLAGVDDLMARKRVPRVTRAAICAVLGYPVAVTGYYLAIESTQLRGLFSGGLAIAGLFGIIPAAVCSWVSEGMKQTIPTSG